MATQVSKTVEKFGVEVRRPDFDRTWRRLDSAGTFPNRQRATDEVHFCRDRNPSCEYRVCNLSQPPAIVVESEAAALPPAPEEDANWRGMIYLLRKGPGDAMERFADQYPIPTTWIEAVIRQAGTQDGDWKLLEAAGSLLADFENWSLRAAHAMRDRKAIKFDSLVSELMTLLMQMRGDQPSDIDSQAKNDDTTEPMREGKR